MSTGTWISALYAGGSLVCELALKVLQINTFRRYNKRGVNTNVINEVLFYGAENEDHMKQIGLDNLLCIYYVIIHGSRTVDVCVPSLVSETLAQCLINVQKNNVKVRIIIHNSDNFDNLQLFAQNGIEVKIVKPAVPLEHEFVLIDVGECGESHSLDAGAGAVAVLGSLDYEISRPNCNRDATLLTSDTGVITALDREFNRVWNSSVDIKQNTDDFNFSAGFENI